MERRGELFYCVIAVTVAIVSLNLVRCSGTSDKEILEQVPSIDDLQAKCNLLSVLPEYEHVFHCTENLEDDYADVLEEAREMSPKSGSEKLFSQIILWESRIKEKKPTYSFIFSKSHEPEEHQLESVITYAYFFKAKKLFEDDQMLAALADIMHLRGLRSETKGISMSPISDFEVRVRMSIRKACASNIDSLFGLKPTSSLVDLERSYRRLNNIMKKSTHSFPGLKKELNTINNIAEAAYRIKKFDIALRESDQFNTRPYSSGASSSRIEENDAQQVPVYGHSNLMAPSEKTLPTSCDQSSSMANSSKKDDFEDEMRYFNAKYQEMQLLLIRDDCIRAIQLCDEITSRLESKIANSGQLKLRKKQIAKLKQARNQAQFHKVLALDKDRQTPDAYEELVRLIRMQKEDGTRPDKETLKLKELLKSALTTPN